ncbi:hypothetical protein ABIA68_002095 [Stenotrophomonas rhizophila]|uniref:hypothetical protein n=1 Tax=Stenotrophomonas rhizophila TaxID=216778 RepID=UPI0033979B96
MELNNWFFTVAASLLSGVVGAALGALASWFGAFQSTSRSIREQRERDQRLDNDAVVATIQAVMDEMRAIVQVHQQSGGSEIEASDGATGIAMYYPISDHYFTVFNANAGAIGRIRNPQLRVRLVVTNVYFKALIDTIRLNNHFGERVESADRAHRHNPDSEECQRDLALACDQHASYAPSLILSHRRAMTAFGELDAVVRAIGI